MSKVISLIVLMVFAFLFLSVKAVAAAEPVTVGFISREPQSFYDNVVRPYWSHLSGGSSVKLVQLTPFNKNGKVDLKRLAKSIQSAPTNVKTIYVHWNEKYDSTHDVWLNALRRKTNAGVKVAFFAGMAGRNSQALSLRKTLAAQVPKAIILGELLERERLPPQHYYGPELLSAFQADSSLGIQGLAPLRFMERWSLQANQNLDQSLYNFRKKKMKSLRMWPTTNDFF